MSQLPGFGRYVFGRYVSQGATFDEPERVYRFRLWRYWTLPFAKGYVLWLMLNPSTADEHVLDPTLRRCEDYSRRWGFDGFEVCNLFALRATDPEAMKDHNCPVSRPLSEQSIRRKPLDPLDFSAENDWVIVERAQNAGLIVCAWGNDGKHLDRANTVRYMLRTRVCRAVHCLDISKVGEPVHPLYQAKSLMPALYDLTPVESVRRRSRSRSTV